FTTLRSSYLSHPNYRGEIKCAGKRSYMLKRKITAIKPYKVPLLPTKKAVLLKNCFVHLNSKNDNSIDCQKSSRRFRSTGFHCWLFKPNESLVISSSNCYQSSISGGNCLTAGIDLSSMVKEYLRDNKSFNSLFA